MKNLHLTAILGAALFLAFAQCTKIKEGTIFVEKEPRLVNADFVSSLDLFRGAMANQPSDNSITNYGAQLGKVLFYDTRLSKTNTISCASCHKQAFAFADNVAFSQGFNGQVTKRNSMPLINEQFNFSFFWDGRSTILEEQVLMPVKDHIEMGMEDLDKLSSKLSSTTFYKPLFEKAFGTEVINHNNISKALAQFIRSIPSSESKFDKGLTSNFSNFNAQEALGMKLFKEKGNCNGCHQVINEPSDFVLIDFIDQFPGSDYISSSNAFSKKEANIGLDLTDRDKGIGNGVFKVPSLRNLALTAPYMHDGRFANLMDVVNHYDHQVKDNPNLDKRLLDNNGNIRRLGLNQNEKEALVAFLKTLTDYNITKDVKFNDPFNY